MKRTSLLRKDRIVDYQRIVRAQRFSPSPIRKSSGSRISTKLHKQHMQSFTPHNMNKENSGMYNSTAENDKENNDDCRTNDATPEAITLTPNQIQGVSPKLEVDNMGLFKLPMMKAKAFK